MHEHHPPIAVLYHESCPDGFGAAYAAWKKFGDTAEYIPVKYGDEPPAGLAGREVYIVDFCYEDQEQLGMLAREAKRLVVLDHHKSNREQVESTPEHVYDANRSGATIAWNYFHPETPAPRLMRYLEDGDLYRFDLPETHDIFSYLLVLPYHFDVWDRLAQSLEDPAERARILEKSAAYTEFSDALVHASVNKAKLVRFEGREVYFAATYPNITVKSAVGNALYTKQPPFALVVTAHPTGYGVSIRGDGSVDVSKIAEKYGGGGHPGSAGFFIPNNSVMPWEEIDDHEDSRY